jgi:hypothetical protein
MQMTENIDRQVQSAIDYYLRFAIENRLIIQTELQQAAINQFSLNGKQIAEFRLKIYQLNMQARYIDADDKSQS